MGGDGAYRAVGIAREMTETNGVSLRHRLYLKTEDAQLVHHPWHAVGHHTKVFGTYEHTCGLSELRHLLHSLLIPELVVAAIEIIVVEAVEVILVVVPQLLVDK